MTIRYDSTRYIYFAKGYRVGIPLDGIAGRYGWGYQTGKQVLISAIFLKVYHSIPAEPDSGSQNISVILCTHCRIRPFPSRTSFPLLKLKDPHRRPFLPVQNFLVQNLRKQLEILQDCNCDLSRNMEQAPIAPRPGAEALSQARSHRD